MGQRIRKYRKNKGYTQEYVACALGISRQAVFKWEKDQTKPDTANLIALAELLGTTVEYLTAGFRSQDTRHKTVGRYLRASILPLLLIPLCWLVGLFSGVYTDMVQIPINSGIRIGIPFLMYGHSPAAIMLLSVSAVCLVMVGILLILAYLAGKE